MPCLRITTVLIKGFVHSMSKEYDELEVIERSKCSRTSGFTEPRLDPDVLLDQRTGL